MPLEIRKLIREMSLANLLWGASRIHGELLRLVIDVGQTSVAKQQAQKRMNQVTVKLVPGGITCQPLPEGDVVYSYIAGTLMENAFIQVRRQWNDSNNIATYRIEEISGLHFSDLSGGVRARALRKFLHGYVSCDAMVDGSLSHSCRHGTGPHSIKVCITKKGNESIYPELIRRARSQRS